MEISDIPKDKKVILFDGVCILCNTAVRYIIKFDTQNHFLFAEIESDIGKKIIKHIGINIQNTDSIILYNPKIAYYYKSEAVFQIVKHLKGFIYVISFFHFLPTFFSDFIYDFIARNRYKWFGKQDFCVMPNETLTNKILK